MTEAKVINCEEARERWHARLDDGEADPRLERHLADCPACRTYAEQMGRVLAGLDALREESEQIVVSDSGISGPVPEVVLAPPWLLETMRCLRVAAALALMVVGGWYFGWHLTGTVRTPGSVPPGITTSGTPDASSAFIFRLCGQTAEKYLAVPTPAPEPNVRVVWLYPVFERPDQNGE